MTACPKPQRIQSKALTDSARGRYCTMRLTGCTGNPEQTVFSHLRGKWSLGLATKPADFFGVYACAHCHDVIDGREPQDVAGEDLLRGLYETQMAMFEAGLLKVKK